MSKKKQDYNEEKKYPKTIIISGKALNKVKKMSEKMDRTEHYLMAKKIENEFGK